MKKLKLLRRILFQILQNHRAMLEYLSEDPVHSREGRYTYLKRTLFICKEDTDFLIDEMREVFRK